MFYKLFLLASMAALINPGFCRKRGTNKNQTITSMSTTSNNNDNIIGSTMKTTKEVRRGNHSIKTTERPDNKTNITTTELRYCFEISDPEFKHYIVPGFVGFGSVLGTAFLIGAICNFCAYCCSDKSGAGDGNPKKKQSKKRQKFDAKGKTGSKKHKAHGASPMKHKAPVARTR